MKIEEVRSKTDSELAYDLEKMRKELFDLRFRATVDSSSNTAKITTLRRSIARVHTILHERQVQLRGQEQE